MEILARGHKGLRHKNKGEDSIFEEYSSLKIVPSDYSSWKPVSQNGVERRTRRMNRKNEISHVRIKL